MRLEAGITDSPSRFTRGGLLDATIFAASVFFFFAVIFETEDTVADFFLLCGREVLAFAMFDRDALDRAVFREELAGLFFFLEFFFAGIGQVYHCIRLPDGSSFAGNAHLPSPCLPASFGIQFVNRLAFTKL
jgi:hypothetical protein